jgi:hypothetical protein
VSTPGYGDPGRGVYVEKPKSNIYTVLLAVALFALIVASAFLLVEMNRYEFDRKAPTASAPSSTLADSLRTWTA